MYENVNPSHPGQDGDKTKVPKEVVAKCSVYREYNNNFPTQNHEAQQEPLAKMSQHSLTVKKIDGKPGQVYYP